MLTKGVIIIVVCKNPASQGVFELSKHLALKAKRISGSIPNTILETIRREKDELYTGGRIASTEPAEGQAHKNGFRNRRRPFFVRLNARPGGQTPAQNIAACVGGARAPSSEFRKPQRWGRR